MSNKDLQLLGTINSRETRAMLERELSTLGIEESNVENPLDTIVLRELTKLQSAIRASDDDFILFSFVNDIKKIWKMVIQKSIKCLRYFDSREPFMDIPTKEPIAYGINDLCEYFEKYSDFESMLYGGSKYYRDHVVHVFRTWLLGMECLLKNNGAYLSKINISENAIVNSFEKLSIWSMISLTHDLGYPLEKAQEIILKTKEMMKAFVANPNISMDLSFSGIQNNMNDFVLRFLSSKMQKKTDNDPDGKNYVARLQPKYYFKFQKSLEESTHGIISSIIIYKLLIYFLESDYNINEDYSFNDEEVRQFYIRREILRSIASHTCQDIYHLNMLSFAYLLIVVDDAQEWGRKRISELYVKSDIVYELENINLSFNSEGESEGGSEGNPEGNRRRHSCVLSEKFVLPNKMDVLKHVLLSLQEQSMRYKEIFRDGQDTSNRNFTFVKKCHVDYDTNPRVKIDIVFNIYHDRNSNFSIEVQKTGTNNIDLNFSDNWIYDTFGLSQAEIDNCKTTIGDKTIYNIPDKNE